jgi:iron-regulated transporter 1
MIKDVEAESRGAFSTVEAAYQSLFELFSYGSTLVFYRPDQFKWPALISTVAVALANVAYATFVFFQKR